MKGNRWLDLAPSALLALGIVAGQAAQAAWNDLAGTTVLALSLLCADLLSLRLRGAAARPSTASWIMAAAFTIAGCIGLLREPGHGGSLVPLLGLGAWTVFFSGDRHRRRPCTIAPSH